MHAYGRLLRRLGGVYLLGVVLGLTVLPGCAPAAPAGGAPAEVVSEAPVCARSVDGKLVDAPCPTPGRGGRS
jgi:hypothetical protein